MASFTLTEISSVPGIALEDNLPVAIITSRKFRDEHATSIWMVLCTIGEKVLAIATHDKEERSPFVAISTNALFFELLGMPKTQIINNNCKSRLSHPQYPVLKDEFY